MEATLLGKLLLGLLGALGLLYGLMLRPWRPRRMWMRRAPAVDVLFVAALVAGATAVIGTPPFERAAVVLVDQTELPASLAAIDERIREVEELPERIWQDLTERLGWTDDPPPALDLAEGPGVVGGTVLPAVTAVVEVLVRAFVYWSSLIVLCICLVMRLAIGVKRAVSTAISAPRPDVMLEGRIAELEEIVVVLRAGPGGATAGP